MPREKFSRLEIVFILGVVLSSCLFLVFLRLNLIQTSEAAANLFSQQNRMEIANGETMPLALKLNAMMAQESVECVSALLNDQIFVNAKKTLCSTGIITQLQEIRSPSNPNLKINISFKMPNLLILSALSLVLAQFFLILMFFKMYSGNLKKIIQTKEQLADIARKVAHDIRSPLTVLNSLTSDVSSMKSEQKFLLKQVMHRINTIADDVLVESNKQAQEVQGLRASLKTNDPKHCDIISCLEDIIAEKQAEFIEIKNLSIQLRTHDQNTPLLAAVTETQLKRILSNLINNSIESLVSDGRIIIEAFSRNQSIYIVLTDFGCGISEENLKNLGRKQFSTKQGHPNKNSGIGVFSAQEYLSKIGGSLSFASKEGLGTKATLQLPIIS